MRSRDLAQVALFTAIMVVLGFFPLIQLPGAFAPFTSQTLGVILAGSILGAKRGTLAMLLFVVLVLVGLPVLPGGRGGLSVILGPTGGFVLAYPIGALVIGLLTERLWRRYSLPVALAINFFGGAIVLYAIGIPWMAVAADIPLGKAIVTSAAFLPGDAVKTVIGSLAAVAVRRAYPLIPARA
ncbi:biotin transporter BioY [Nocardia otitidiscaviarum]|uniref:Biotin transporter n=1 Tax=Nocardia otitidiscaviarum TaxID=1823 RepID=A0A516NHQ3_9NOCA|nr:biotin transporter BioY [Nocardia otitidiscaviarum]MCP9620105.1 biotin transporter BioY [Nocardia otitidiscaviarum]QDP78399.1 biotin transporter BioY [Nocardia otitidiscaviarum]